VFDLRLQCRKMCQSHSTNQPEDGAVPIRALLALQRHLARLVVHKGKRHAICKSLNLLVLDLHRQCPISAIADVRLIFGSSPRSNRR
jgi:hypothetical protein